MKNAGFLLAGWLTNQMITPPTPAIKYLNTLIDIAKFAHTVSSDILEMLFASRLMTSVTWQTVGYAIEGGLRYQALKYLVGKVHCPPIPHTLPSLAFNHGCEGRIYFILLLIFAEENKSILRVDMERAVHAFRTSEQLCILLDLLEVSHGTPPTESTVDGLLSGKFDRSCVDLFLKKFPNLYLNNDQLHAAMRNVNLSAEILCKLIVRTRYPRLPKSILTSFGADLAEDIFLIMLAELEHPIGMEEILMAVRRGYSEPTIRFMIRRCKEIRYGSKRLLEFDKCAVSGGYSLELLAFAKEHLGHKN